MTKVSPERSMADPAAMVPIRILGPVKSSTTGTKASSFFATARTLSIMRAWVSGVPCDALMRATFMPA